MEKEKDTKATGWHDQRHGNMKTHGVWKSSGMEKLVAQHRAEYLHEDESLVSI